VLLGGLNYLIEHHLFPDTPIACASGSSGLLRDHRAYPGDACFFTW
jgi:fatty acid desaturase